jgi:hypothetical protein
MNVKNRIRDVTLLEHMLVLVKFEDRFPRAHPGEKFFGIKHVLDWPLHGSLLWLNELIDFGWSRSAKPAFALSGALQFQPGHHFRGLPRFAKTTT